MAGQYNPAGSADGRVGRASAMLGHPSPAGSAPAVDAVQRRRSMWLPAVSECGQRDPASTDLQPAFCPERFEVRARWRKPASGAVSGAEAKRNLLVAEWYLERRSVRGGRRKARRSIPTATWALRTMRDSAAGLARCCSFRAYAGRLHRCGPARSGARLCRAGDRPPADTPAVRHSLGAAGALPRAPGGTRAHPGAEGPSVRKRTVATCTQCRGSGRMPDHTVDLARNRGARLVSGVRIARKVNPRVRPPVCCVQYAGRGDDIASNSGCTP